MATNDRQGDPRNDPRNAKSGPSLKERLLALLGGATATPTRAWATPFDDAVPDGLARIYLANSAAEADLLRQVLVEAGFRAEFVPSTAAGVFGTLGNNAVHVHREDAEAASAFLREYLDAPPIEDDAREEP